MPWPTVHGNYKTKKRSPIKVQQKQQYNFHDQIHKGTCIQKLSPTGALLLSDGHRHAPVCRTKKEYKLD